MNDALISPRRHFCYPTEDAQNQRVTKSNCIKPPKRRWWVEWLRNLQSAVIPHSDNHPIIINMPNPNSWMQKAVLSGKYNTTTQFWKKKGYLFRKHQDTASTADILDSFLSPQKLIYVLQVKATNFLEKQLFLNTWIGSEIFNVSP